MPGAKETAVRMAARHIAEQLNRIERHERLIAELRRDGQSTTKAETLLADMHDLLGLMRQREGQLLRLRGKEHAQHAAT